MRNRLLMGVVGVLLLAVLVVAGIFWKASSSLLEPEDEPFPAQPSSLPVEIAERRAGVDLSDVEPERTIGQISPRPLLIIHATGDTRVRFDQSEKLFARAGEPKELWTLDGDVHADALKVDPEGYKTRVIPFLQNALDN